MTSSSKSIQIKLGAFLRGGGQHVAACRHPDAPADGATNFEFHRQLCADRRARPVRCLFPGQHPVVVQAG